VRARSLKQRISSGFQKVIHVAGRSKLADLNTKSHPHSRLAALRKIWSIERIDQTEERSSDSDAHKTKAKMIRIKPTIAPMNVDEEEENPNRQNHEEHGYRTGARGDQSEINLLEHLRMIENTENALEKEYEEGTKRIAKVGDSEEIEDILWRQIDIERERVRTYEIAYVQEKLLRMQRYMNLGSMKRECLEK
jgi:hypothetical protein